MGWSDGYPVSTNNGSYFAGYYNDGLAGGGESMFMQDGLEIARSVNKGNE